MPLRKVCDEATSGLNVHTHPYDIVLRHTERRQAGGRAYIHLEWQLRMHGARSHSAGRQKYLKRYDKLMRLQGRRHGKTMTNVCFHQDQTAPGRSAYAPSVHTRAPSARVPRRPDGRAHQCGLPRRNRGYPSHPCATRALCGGRAPNGTTWARGAAVGHSHAAGGESSAMGHLGGAGAPSGYGRMRARGGRILCRC